MASRKCIACSLILLVLLHSLLCGAHSARDFGRLRGGFDHEQQRRAGALGDEKRRVRTGSNPLHNR